MDPESLVAYVAVTSSAPLTAKISSKKKRSLTFRRKKNEESMSSDHSSQDFDLNTPSQKKEVNIKKQLVPESKPLLSPISQSQKDYIVVG